MAGWITPAPGGSSRGHGKVNKRRLSAQVGWTEGCALRDFDRLTIRALRGVQEREDRLLFLGVIEGVEDADSVHAAASVAVDRRGKLLAPHIERARVIAVLVREQDAVDLQRVHAAQRQPRPDLPRAEPAIDEQPRLRRLHQRAVSRTAAAEDGDEKHGRE